MQPELQRVEIEAARGDDDDLAIDDATRRQPLEQCVVQLGKIAIERLQIAALDVDVARREKRSRESRPIWARTDSRHPRQGVGDLGQHRLDGRGHPGTVGMTTAKPALLPRWQIVGSQTPIPSHHHSNVVLIDHIGVGDDSEFKPWLGCGGTLFRQPKTIQCAYRPKSRQPCQIDQEPRDPLFPRHMDGFNTRSRAFFE